MGEKRAERLRAALGDVLPRDWRGSGPLGYPSQIELAIIAAVFRGADDPDVAFQVTARYMQARPGKRLDSALDLGKMGTDQIAHAVGAPFGSATVVGGKFLRVDLAGEIASALAAAQVNTAEDFREAALVRPLELESAVVDVPRSGPVTYIQLATLLRADTRPGSGVADWIRGVIDDPSISRADVHRVLQQAAVAAGSEPFVLHFALSQMVAAEVAAEKTSAKKVAAKRKPATTKSRVAKKKRTATKPAARKPVKEKPVAE